MEKKEENTNRIIYVTAIDKKSYDLLNKKGLKFIYKDPNKDLYTFEYSESLMNRFSRNDLNSLKGKVMFSDKLTLRF